MRDNQGYFDVISVENLLVCRAEGVVVVVVDGFNFLLRSSNLSTSRTLHVCFHCPER